jgi:hypothetical protein
MDIPLEPTAADLEDPKFYTWIKAKYGQVKPDPQDYPTMTPDDEKRASVDAEYAAYQHKLASTNKLIRLWREWKKNQN